MVGKIISKTADSDEAALLKSSRNEDRAGGTGEIPVFKSLLDALQGGHSGAYNKESLLTGEIHSEDRLGSLPKENAGDQLDQQPENIFRILSEGSLEKEDLKSQLGQLLNKLKQEGRGKPGSLAEDVSMGTGGAESEVRRDGKVPIEKVIEEIYSRLSGELSDVEMRRLTEAVESGQMSKTSAEATHLFTGGNLEGGNHRTQLKQLFDKLKKVAGGQIPQLRFETAEGLSRMEAGSEQVRPSDKAIPGMGQSSPGLLSDEEMAGLTKSVESVEMSKVSANIARLFSDGSLEDGEIKTELRKLLQQLKQPGQRSAAMHTESEVSTEKGLAENGQNRESAPGEENKNLPLEKRLPQNTVPDSGKKTITGVIPDAGREENAGKQKELTDSIFPKGDSRSVTEPVPRVTGEQEKALKKEERDLPGRGARPDAIREREGTLLFGGSSPFGSGSRDQSSGSSGGSVPLGSDENGELIADEYVTVWKEYTTESGETQEEKESIQQPHASPSLKLGQIPIANGALRQKVLPGLTQNILKAASDAKKHPEQWQKHNFILDDGKEMQLSVREAKGVLQVKMGSMNLDLSKLLQQHLQQIREHLRQEFGTDIDLQLDDARQEGPGNHYSKSSSNGENTRQAGSGEGVAGSAETGEEKITAVRNFGYNHMEWTA